MDELDRLYRRVVHNIRAAFPELQTRAFEVAQLYQQIVPYRTNRRELDFDSNEEYELALMQLLAGLRGYLSGDADLQKAMRQELASPNPDLTAFRVFATSAVSLAPDALRSLERRGGASEGTASIVASLSPSEQVVLAGRDTEAVDVVDGRVSDRPSASATVAAAAGSPPPRPATPNASHASPPRPPFPAAPGAPQRRDIALDSSDASMTVPRSTPHPVAAGESCRYCGSALPDGRRVTFCPSCGQNVTVQHCPACATELEVGWKFCISCGRMVGESSNGTHDGDDDG